MGQTRKRSLAAFICLMLFPVSAFGQRGVSGVAGVVTDATGAVLPGVTVEAASPALIEKVRTTVTDSRGLYQITDLRPGTYTVTFTLAGFGTIKQEGINLPPNFTAPVDVELKLGELTETVTVSGQGPVVDVQNVVQQRAVSQLVLNAIPTAKGEKGLASLTPAVITPANSLDVGGSRDSASVRMAIHGGKQSDQKLLQDGMRYNSMNLDGAARIFYINPATAQEFVVDLGAGGSAEYSTGGTQVNLVPKDGGNIFSGYFYSTVTGHQFQANNLTAELQARGLPTVNGVRQIFDVNPATGGPIRQDKLWFYSAHRWWGKTLRVADLYYNATPESWVYTPDLRRPVDITDRSFSHNIRLTWQATGKQKITASYDWQRHGFDNGGAALVGRSPEAATRSNYYGDSLSQATWTYTASHRVLFEAGVSLLDVKDTLGRPLTGFGSASKLGESGLDAISFLERNGFDGISVLEQSTNFTYRAPVSETLEIQPTTNQRFSMSYITGSHNVKVGLFTQMGSYRKVITRNSRAITYTFSRGVPIQLTQYASPLPTKEVLKPELGLFAQDQWRIKRLTLNVGLRFEYLHAYVPTSDNPATLFLDARRFESVDCVPCWKDLNPRFGVSYDLFANGKTALKASLGRYTAAATVGTASANNPMNTSVNQINRSWTDGNGNFFPDCDLRSPLQNGECGPMSNANFGKPNVTTRYDPETLNGWQHRGFNWQASAMIEHELRPGVAVSAGYFRTWYGNFLATDNLEVTPSDYDPYCITALVDPRLPGGGGNRICGLYNIRPAKFGLVNNLVTFASKYGKQTERYNGVDLNVNARLPGDALLGGGVNIGNALSTGGTFTTSSTNRCFVVDSPQELYNCDVPIPYQTRFKMFVAYPLPWDLQASANFQTLPGAPYTATYNATTAEIAPSLGRNLAGAARTTPIELIRPFSQFEERINLLDVRLSKIFQVGRFRIQGNFDVFNALNVSPAVVVNSTYGARWLVPQDILDARLAKFGVQLSF